MPKDEFDLDDPLELNGHALLTDEDTTVPMTECFVEEFMRMGYSPARVLALFRNSHYLGMHMVYTRRGETFVRDTISSVFARWGKSFTWPAPTGEPLPRPSCPTEARARETLTPSLSHRMGEGVLSALDSSPSHPMGEGVRALDSSPSHRMGEGARQGG